MLLFFKFSQAVLEILEFSPKKEGFLDKRELIYPEWRQRFLMGFFHFLRKNTHDFVKNEPKFKKEGLLHAKF